MFVLLSLNLSACFGPLACASVAVRWMCPKRELTRSSFVFFAGRFSNGAVDGKEGGARDAYRPTRRGKRLSSRGPARPERWNCDFVLVFVLFVFSFCLCFLCFLCFLCVSVLCVFVFLFDLCLFVFCCLF